MQLIDSGALCSRFHNPKEEPVLDSNVAPHLDDNIQLSIGQYRDKLYEVHAYVCNSLECRVAMVKLKKIQLVP